MSKLINRASKNKVSRQLFYKTVVGVFPILIRFAANFEEYDVRRLFDIIQSMTVDEFLDYKFKEDES